MAHVVDAQRQGGRDYDYLFKLLIIGDAGVGKSSLLLRFADNTFTSAYINTIGVDFKIRTVKLDGITIKLQIWDTAGQERFRTITATYYRGTHGVIVVYDVTDKESFENVRRWMNEIDNNCDTNQNAVNRVLVGNKCDMQNEVAVTQQEADDYAQSINVKHFRCSAKENTAVEDMFTQITRMALNAKRRQEQNANPNQHRGGGNIDLRQSAHNQKKKSNCC